MVYKHVEPEKNYWEMVHVLHAKNIVELKEMESNVDRINVKIDRS